MNKITKYSSLIKIIIYSILFLIVFILIRELLYLIECNQLLIDENSEMIKEVLKYMRKSWTQ